MNKRLSMMREAFIDAEVTGYQNLIPVMTNNAKDRHVLAAAVRVFGGIQGDHVGVAFRRWG